MNRRILSIAASALGLSSLYALLLRPQMLRWGATKEEIASPFPDKDIVPDGTRSATMAITIDAAPKYVWPYLAQMGADRGGWYSWDRLDNWGRSSADHVHAEWQNIAVGDFFTASPDGTMGWKVAALEPERFLALRAMVDLRGKPFNGRALFPRHYSDSTWSFLLRPLDAMHTRLVVSGYWHLEPRWLQPIFSALLLEPSHFVMQTRQFHNLKRLAERDARLELHYKPDWRKYATTDSL